MLMSLRFSLCVYWRNRTLLCTCMWKVDFEIHSVKNPSRVKWPCSSATSIGVFPFSSSHHATKNEVITHQNWGTKKKVCSRKKQLTIEKSLQNIHAIILTYELNDVNLKVKSCKRTCNGLNPTLFCAFTLISPKSASMRKPSTLLSLHNLKVESKRYWNRR